MLELKNLVFEVPADDGGTKRIIDNLSLTIPDDRFTVHHRTQRRRQVHAGQAHHGHREAHRAARSSVERRGHHGPVHHRARPPGHRLRLPAAGPLQGHEGEEAARSSPPARSCPCSPCNEYLLEGGPVRRRATSTREVDKSPVRRRGEAHRDRHHPGPRHRSWPSSTSRRPASTCGASTVSPRRSATSTRPATGAPSSSSRTRSVSSRWPTRSCFCATARWPRRARRPSSCRGSGSRPAAWTITAARFPPPPSCT